MRSSASGTTPAPSLPVDSAISCSSQSPIEPTAGSAMIVSLSRPAATLSPSRAPSCSGTFSAGSVSGPDRASTSAALSSSGAMSIPDSAAGTRPKYDSAENRPPMSGRFRNVCRKPRSSARAASFEPGSADRDEARARRLP